MLVDSFDAIQELLGEPPYALSKETEAEAKKADEVVTTTTTKNIVLADGTSVVKLRHPSELPQITARAYWNQGLKYRIDELLGPTYGIGLHHDQSGFVWTEVHAGSTLQELIEDLGVPAVIAAVPSVIETDGTHIPPLHTSTAPLPYARPVL